jgi:hypothetical protein
MDSLSKNIGMIFDGLTSTVDRKLAQAEILKVLVEKHEKCKNSNEYAKLLLSNIAFDMETTKALLMILNESFNNSKFPVVKGVSEVMREAQNHIEEGMDTLFPIYSKIIEGVPEEERILKLESTFAASKVEQDLIVIFLEAFGQESNQEYFRPLFSAKSEDVIELIKKYSSLYTSLFLDGVELSSEPVA